MASASASAATATIAKDDPELSDVLHYLWRLLTSTNASTENQVRGLVADFSDCFFRSGVSLQTFERRSISLLGKGMTEACVSDILGRSFETDAAAKYGQLLLEFFKTWPRTAFMTRIWPKVAEIVRRKADDAGTSKRKADEEPPWDDEDLTFEMVEFAWKHRTPGRESVVLNGPQQPSIHHNNNARRGESSNNCHNNNDNATRRGNSNNDNNDHSSCVVGYEKMREDMAWKMGHSDNEEEGAARTLANRFVQGLQSVGIDYRQLMKIYHSDKNEDNFKARMKGVLSGPSSSLTNAEERRRLIRLLLWWFPFARAKAMPKGASALNKKTAAPNAARKCNKL